MPNATEIFFAVIAATAITFTYIGILNVLCAFFPEPRRSRKAGAK